jgi:hypothetical protein
MWTQLTWHVVLLHHQPLHLFQLLHLHRLKRQGSTKKNWLCLFFFLGLFGVNVWEHRLEVFKLTRVGFRELQNLNTNTWIVNSNCDALLHFLTSACWSLLHHTIVHCVLFIRSHWMLSHQFEDIVGGRGGSSHILNIYT